MATLPPGQYYGETVRSRGIPGLSLTETVYPPGTVIPLHQHAHGYFCLVRSGNYLETFGGRERSCGPATLAFHPPGELHSERFGDAAVSSFNVEVAPEWLHGLGVPVRCFEDALACRGSEPEALATRLYREFLENDDASRLAIEGLVLQTLAVASRAPRSTLRRPPWFGRVIERLHGGPEQPSLGDLAALAGVHPVYLARAFRKFQRCTIGEYVRQLRVEQARREILDPRLPLKEIAGRAGFADQSHFTRCFRRLTGMTPNDYRRLNAAASRNSEARPVPAR